jgi:protoporphyrinogen/coproporphyrinogen III oxidase
MHVVIVGGGIAGLAAAYFLGAHPRWPSGARVTVLEGSGRIGGKLSVSEVGGVGVDEGAEALLLTRPEGAGLVADLGLDLVPAGTTSAGIWTRGELRPLPKRQFMGVPSDMAELAESGVVSAAGVERAARDLTAPGTERPGDLSVAAYVGGRLGDEVVDRLVDPLLGGVYAGLSAELSFEATMPALAGVSRRFASLAEAAGSLLPSGVPGPPRAVFGTLVNGLGALPDAVAKASGATVRTGAMVRSLARTRPGGGRDGGAGPDGAQDSGAGWRLTVGPASAPEHIDADAVILAVPARPASRLLSEVAPAASAGLGEIPYASMAIVTLAYPRGAFPGARGSGYLVPAVDGHAVKAVTYSTVKWPHLLDELEIVRCSVGRFGEEAVLQREDADLVSAASRELAVASGVAGAPVASRVTRWGGALPQYTVGHLDRVSRVRSALPDGLAVCGAAYDGVGIPACVGTAHSAADKVMAWLRHATSTS